MKKEYKTFDCEYMRIAENPRYLYMHISVVFGWSFACKGLLFLYDSRTKELKYSHDDRHIYDIRHAIVKESYKVLGSLVVDKDINIKEMLNTHLKDKSIWYDRSDYTLYLKSGNNENYISLYEDEQFDNSPFLWIMDIFHEIIRTTPLETSKQSIWLDRMIKEKYPEMMESEE